MVKVLAVVLLIFIVGCAAEEIVEEEVYSEEGSVDVYFCPGCEDELLSVLEGAEDFVYCALFDIDLESVLDFFNSTSLNVRLVVDGDNELSGYDFIRYDNRNQYSHNKFCVIDNKTILTGSFNPTERGAYYNNNNFVVVESKYLSANYWYEFQELWNGEFGDGEQVRYPEIIFNGKPIKNFFCPEDHCSHHVEEELKKAQESIHFLTFSFTHGGIANEMIMSDVLVKGVFERSKISKYSEYDKLFYQGADVKLDNSPYNMHDKVFIIDGRTVITGSFNPSASADERNDENILIIEDPDIASKYLEHFDYVWNFDMSINGKKEADSVVISSVMYNPDGADTGKEYVELFNPLDEDVSIDYFRLSNNKTMKTLKGSIGAGEHYKYYDLYLTNKKGIVILYDGTLGQLDYVAWGPDSKEASIKRKNYELVNDADAWV